jgi:hypothetical protein
MVSEKSTEREAGFRSNNELQIRSLLPRFLAQLSRSDRALFAVAPVPDFPGALGRVKGPPLRALDPPARSHTFCNYRTIGRVQANDGHS